MPVSLISRPMRFPSSFRSVKMPENSLSGASGSLNRPARTSVTYPLKSAPGISNSGTWSVGPASPGKIKQAKLLATNVS